jgi:hypothetical protein
MYRREFMAALMTIDVANPDVALIIEDIFFFRK